MPIHWNAQGHVDGYSGRAFATLFMPGLNLFLALLLGVIPRLDPKCKKYDAETSLSVGRIFKVIRLIITAFNAAIALALLAYGLHYHFDMNRLIVGGMGLLFAALGNLMGKLRPNYFAGIRTPWTLESRTVWLKTHRLGGQVMVGGGVCLIFASFILPSSALIWWAVAPISIVISIVPLVYSYFCYRSEQKNSGPAH